jgi:hypothetical protein
MIRLERRIKDTAADMRRILAIRNEISDRMELGLIK